MRVTITQESIDRAVRNNSYRCAIVHAIVDGHDERVHGMADVQFLRYSSLIDRMRFFYRTPEVAKRWLERFDAGLKVGPLSFEAELMKSVPMRPPSSLVKTKRRKGDKRAVGEKTSHIRSGYRHFGARLMRVNQPA